MIRKLKQEEIQLVAKYYEKNMKENFQDIGEKFITQKEYENILRKNFNKSSMFVIKDKDLKAFLWFVEEDDEINLEELFSIEKGKGYGKQLMNFLRDYSKKKKIKRINGDVHFKNARAINFFKKLGFTERTVELSLDF